MEDGNSKRYSAFSVLGGIIVSPAIAFRGRAAHSADRGSNRGCDTLPNRRESWSG